MVIEAANPNASEDTKKVLSYIAGLVDRPDQRVVSGQHIGFHIRDILKDYQATIVDLQAQTGRWVALIGTTFGLNATPEQIRTTNQEVLIPYWQAGGLVTVDHHAYNPWTGGYYNDLTDRDLIELITPGTAVNDVWMAELDKVAAGLAELRDAGVVVLWRPFHEMTYREAFWWDSGAHGGQWIDGVYYPVAEPYVSMWRQMFDYFTQEKGLDNLLWVYCPAGETDNWNRVDSMWPGDDCVDIVGLDVYDDNLGFGSGDQPYQRLMQKGKPFGLFEVGPGNTGGGSWDTRAIIDAVRERYPAVVLWQSWSSWEGMKVALVDNQNSPALLADPWVMTREEVDWTGMAFTEHPNYSQIETERAAMFAKLESEQAKRGAFLQCLITPAEDLDGLTLAGFSTDRKPSDEGEDWTALDVAGSVASGVRCQYYVHRYDGPRGSGYILGCRVVWGGFEWKYEEHHGPEERHGPFGRWWGHEVGAD